MKCRLRQTLLAPVELALARQKSLAEQALGSLQRQPLHEVLGVRYQDLFDQVRVIEKVGVLHTELKIGDVTVLLRQILKEGQHAAAVREKTRERGSLSRTGR